MVLHMLGALAEYMMLRRDVVVWVKDGQLELIVRNSYLDEVPCTCLGVACGDGVRGLVSLSPTSHGIDTGFRTCCRV